MEDTSADATGGPASVNSSSRARSGCGSGSSGEPSMTPTDRPSPAVPELDGAADVAVVDDEDGDGGGERNSDGGGERDGDSGSGSGGGGGGSSEALAVPGSPLVGSSGDRDKPADHSFLDLPPRKRSRNTSYSGRFENGKFEGHEIEVIRPPREKPGQCGSWVWKYFVRFRVVDSLADGAGENSVPPRRKRSTCASASMESPVDGEGSGSPKLKQTLLAVCQVPMPLPFGVDRDTVRETAMLCNNVQPYYGVSNLARHIKKIHPELYMRETSDIMSRRRSAATPDSAGSTPMGAKALISPTDMGGRLPPVMAMNMWDRDGGSATIPAFEAKLSSAMTVRERRSGPEGAGGGEELAKGYEHKAKVKSGDQFQQESDGADPVIHTPAYSPALASRQPQRLPSAIVGSEDDLVPSIFGTGGVTKKRAEMERRCVLWCIQGLYPWCILSENKGLAWVLGPAPGTVDDLVTPPSKSAYERILQEEYDRGRKRVLAELTAMRDWIQVGPFGHLVVQCTHADEHTEWLTLSLVFLNRRFEQCVLNLETMAVDASIASSEETSYHIRDRAFQWLAPVIQSDLSEAVSAVVLERTDSVSSEASKLFPREEALQEALRVPVIPSLADTFDIMMQRAFDSVIDLGSDSLNKLRKHDRISNTVLHAFSLIERLCRCKKSEEIMNVIHNEIAQIGAITGLANVDEEVVLKRIAERFEQPPRPSAAFPQPNWMMAYLALDRMLCLQNSISTLTGSDTELRRDCASFDFAMCREVASALDPFAEFRTFARDSLDNTLPRMSAMMRELVAYCDGDQADVRSPTYSDQHRTVVSKDCLSSAVISLFDAIQNQVKMHQSREQFKDSLRFQRLATFFDLWHRDELDSSSLATSKAEAGEELREMQMRKSSPQPESKRPAPEAHAVGLKVSGGFFGKRQRYPYQQRHHQHLPKQQASALSSDSASKETDCYLKTSLSLEDEASYHFPQWWRERAGDAEKPTHKKSLPQLAKLAARYGAYRASYDSEANVAALASRLHAMHQSACLDQVNKAYFVKSCIARYQKDEAISTQ